MAVLIELATDNNNYVIWPPTGEKFRGRWKSATVAHKDKSDFGKALSRIEVIPGMCIAIDPEKMEAFIYDGLDEGEGKVVLRQLTELQQKFPNEYPPPGPHPKQRFELNHDSLKEWLHYAVVLVNQKMALRLPASEPLPSLEKIALLPGKRRSDPYSTGSYDDKLKSKQFVDAVAVPPRTGKKEPEAAGAGAGNGAGGARNQA